MSPSDWAGIGTFGFFMFKPLLKGVGPTYTTIIICTGLLGIAAVRIYGLYKGVPVDEDEDEDEEFSRGY